jgi:hypothetical protein
MNKNFVAGLCLLALSSAVMPTLAQDPQKCLECHEPAEDWAGLSVEEIMTAAKAPDNKRHAPNQALSDEQLRLIITELLPR